LADLERVDLYGYKVMTISLVCLPDTRSHNMRNLQLLTPHFIHLNNTGCRSYIRIVFSGGWVAEDQSLH